MSFKLPVDLCKSMSVDVLKMTVANLKLSAKFFKPICRVSRC